MLDKIRLKQRGELSDYYSEMLGSGFDGRLCRYLGIEYADVAERVAAGAADEEILAWAQSVGAPLNQERIDVWNGFATKRGWNDSGSATLAAFKQERGLSDREDIRTFFEFIEIDEGREPPL
jgi:gluconokinase